jgi:hypothetical protein
LFSVAEEAFRGFCDAKTVYPACLSVNSAFEMIPVAMAIAKQPG